MADHDARFKKLLAEFLPEFLTLFFPTPAARFDFAVIDWLDKEVYADPLSGEVRRLDLVARVRVNPSSGPPACEALALIHVEIESRDGIEAFRRRMFAYWEMLRRKYNLPVLPIAVYLRVGLEGVGIDGYDEDCDDLPVLRFRYLYVGLPALDAEAYLGGSNWLGVALAALMRIPTGRRAWFRSEALRRVLLECRENDYRRYLLAECIEAYLALDEAEQREFQQLLLTEPYKEIEPMMLTTYEKGGIEAVRRVILRLGRKRFGQPDAIALATLHGITDLDQLEQLSERLLEVISWQELLQA